MKKVLFLLPILVALGFSENIAVIDSDVIFSELGDVSDARELLETEIEEWEVHADSLQDAIDEIETDLDFTLVMSPVRRSDLEELLEVKQIELQNYVAGTFGPGGLVETRNEQLIAPILSAINAAVQEICVDKDIDVAFDIASGMVVYADDALDITQEVLDLLSTSAGD